MTERTKSEGKETVHQQSYAIVGELVLLSSAIDALLNETLIEVLRLGKSTFLLPVIATLEPSRKLEILKERAKHIKNPTWKKGIEKFVGTVESVFKFRNIACHSVPVFEKGQWNDGTGTLQALFRPCLE